MSQDTIYCRETFIVTTFKPAALRGTSIPVDKGGCITFCLIFCTWTNSLMLAIEFNLVVARVPQEKNLRYPETDFSDYFLTMPEASYTQDPLSALRASSCLAQPLWQSRGQNHFDDVSWLQRGSWGAIASWGSGGTRQWRCTSVLPFSMLQRSSSPDLGATHTPRPSQGSAVDLSWLLLSASTAVRNSPEPMCSCRCLLELPCKHPIVFTCRLGFVFFPVTKKSPSGRAVLFYYLKNYLRPLVIFIRF